MPATDPFRRVRQLGQPATIADTFRRILKMPDSPPTPEPAAPPPSPRVPLNGWYCADCGKVTYAVELAAGTTPMFLGCRATQGCAGTAQSLMYPWGRRARQGADLLPHVIVEQVGWEWYRPELPEIAGLDPMVLDHVERGGLLLRPLTDAGRVLLDSVCDTPERGAGQ